MLFSALDFDESELAIEPHRYCGADEPYSGGWKAFPSDWRTLLESRLLASETLELDCGAIGELPESQRLEMTLRDATGCSAEEVCETLAITPGNQRLLLHRARARVRARLERELDG